MTIDRYPELAADGVGWVDEAAMVEVDRVMIEDLHIGLIQMMENAGRNLARVVLDVHAPQTVAVAAGSGGNGGGGLVAARHLHNAGVEVAVTLTRDGFSGVPGHQLDVLQRMGVTVGTGDLPRADVVIDALIGYSLRGAPHGRTGDLVEALGRCSPVIALDVPSGLDVTSGEAPGAVVPADVTVTLALPKRGLRHAAAVGELLLADISVPPSVAHAVGSAAPDFSSGPILRVVGR